MRVLGVDPGLTRCGIGVLDGGPGIPPRMVEVLTVQDRTLTSLRRRPRATKLDVIGLGRTLLARRHGQIFSQRCPPAPFDLIAVPLPQHPRIPQSLIFATKAYRSEHPQKLLLSKSLISPIGNHLLTLTNRYQRSEAGEQHAPTPRISLDVAEMSHMGL